MLDDTSLLLLLDDEDEEDVPVTPTALTLIVGRLGVEVLSDVEPVTIGGGAVRL